MSVEVILSGLCLGQSRSLVFSTHFGNTCVRIDQLQEFVKCHTVITCAIDIHKRLVSKGHAVEQLT